MREAPTDLGGSVGAFLRRHTSLLSSEALEFATAIGIQSCRLRTDARRTKVAKVSKRH